MIVNFDAIPNEMQSVNRWVLWRYEERDGKVTKEPYQLNGKHASTTSTLTWSSFEAVKTGYNKGGYDGIGFVLGGGFVGIDFDHKIKDNTIDPGTVEDLKLLDSYAEYSPSGEGIHIICQGQFPEDGRKDQGKGIEAYAAGRYFTVTGNRLESYPTEPQHRTDALLEFYKKYFIEEKQSISASSPCDLSDDQIISLAAGAKNGDKFLKLMDGNVEGYPSESEADLALADIISFYTRDKEQIIRIIKRSKLWDEKWERTDYQDRTIDNALTAVSEYYEPPITEDDLRALPVAENPILDVRLEPDNSIMRYIEYGKSTCDAYPEYHYAMALGLHSIGTNRNLVLAMKQGKVYPNMWLFLLGKSTISRKTAATTKGEDFAKDLYPLAAMPQSYSPEGLVEELSQKPRSYLIKDEAASMIEAMQKSYMLEMRDLYCTLFDCKGTRRKLRSGQRKGPREFDVVDPFINLTCATTPESFREYTSLLDLTSGWLLRFIYFYPNYRKPWMAFQPAEQEDFAFYAEILGRLSQIKGMFYGRAEPLEIQLSPEAWTYYQTWQETRETELQDSSDSIELALWGRLAFYALKLSMLFTIGRVDYQEGDSISLEHVTEACRQVDEYFLPIGRLVAEEIAREERNNLQNKILGVLSRHGGKLQWSTLLQNLHVRVKDIEEAIEALLASEEIEDRRVEKEGKKPVRWILSRVKNIKPKTRINQIRYTETKVSKVSNIRKVSNISNVRLDSELEHGISAKDANFANHAKDANFSKLVEREAEPSIGPNPRKDAPTDPGRAKFWAGMKRRHCLKCGRNFPFDLGIHWKDGYLCFDCNRGQTPEPNPQATLGDGEAEA